MTSTHRTCRALALLAIVGGIVALSGCFETSRELIKVPVEDQGSESQQIAVIDIHAPIEDHVAKSMFGGMGDGAVDAEDLCVRLRAAVRDDHVKAIIIDLDSGGGDVTGTAAIAGQIAKARVAGKPVVAVMGSVCASGAYYIAAGCERIFTAPSTITGSIGAIFMSPDLHKLLEGPLNISVNVIKSGPYKDIASPTRQMTDEERALLQKLVDGCYEQFVAAVVEGRRGRAPIPSDITAATAAVRAVADGRVLSGEQALAAGLADERGYLFDAAEYLVRTLKLKGEPQLIRYGRDYGLFGGGVSTAAQSTHINAGLEINAGGAATGMLAPRMEYRWYGK